MKAKDGEAFIAEMENFINTYNRKIIVWSPGIKASKNTWSQYWGFKKDPYPPFTRNAIDSQKNYINNVEPFTCISQYLFKPIGKNIKQHIKGGIICLWHDVNVNNEKEIFDLNPYYLSLTAYIQNLWTAPIKDCSKHLEYHIPISNNELIRYFKSFEDKLMVHQKNFHPKKPFQYSKQINNHWKVYGPIAKNLAANYDSVKKHHPFKHVIGNTVYLKT